jgi:hypothetical protein
VHTATNDIEMMDFEYKEEQENKVSDHDNTGAKSSDRHVAPLVHIILIPNQSVFALSP